MESSLAYEPVLLSILTCVSDCIAPSKISATKNFQQAGNLFSLIIGLPGSKKSLYIDMFENYLRKSEEKLKNSTETEQNNNSNINNSKNIKRRDLI